MDLSWLRPIAAQVSKSMHPGVGLEFDDLVQIGALAVFEAPPHDDASGATQKTWHWKKAAWAMQGAIVTSARRHSLAPMDPLPDDFDRVDDAPTPEECMQHAQRRKALSHALKRIPRHELQLLEAIYVHDAIGADLARRRGVTRKAVSNMHLRALSRLREQLRDYA